MPEENTTATPSDADKTPSPTSEKEGSVDPGVSRAELDKLKKQLAAKEEYADNLRYLAEHTPDQDGWEKAARHVLSEDGYSASQINQYVRRMKEGDQTPEPGGDVRPKAEEREERNDGMADQLAELVESQASLRAEMQAQKDEQNRLEAEYLGKQMTETIRKTVDTSEDLKLLLSKSKALRGEEAMGEVSEALREEVRKALVDEIYAKQAKLGKGAFRSSWFEELAPIATKKVADRFRVVIGDPAGIGKVTETDPGEDIFKRLKEPPKVEDTDTFSDRAKKAEDLATYSLLKAIHGGAPGTNV